jgi:hypothetical protein
MTTKPLSETRAPDRQKMALSLEQLVAECGATYQRSEGGSYPGPNAIKLAIEGAGGLQLSVTFDGKSCQPNIYVMSWHMASGSDLKLNDATFGGNVNPHHKQKATYVARGFEDLCHQLRCGLLMAKDGSAYLPQRAAA